MGQNSKKFKEVEKVPQTFSIFPPPHSSNSLGDCWRLQIKETSFLSLGYLWSLKSEQRYQSTTASYCYSYKTSKPLDSLGQTSSSLIRYSTFSIQTPSFFDIRSKLSYCFLKSFNNNQINLIIFLEYPSGNLQT